MIEIHFLQLEAQVFFLMYSKSHDKCVVFM